MNNQPPETKPTMIFFPVPFDPSHLGLGDLYLGQVLLSPLRCFPREEPGSDGQLYHQQLVDKDAPQADGAACH